jgi:hypothetical protein
VDFKALAAKIAANAPTLGAAIGTVVPGAGNVIGGAVGLGIKALASVFGLGEDATPDQISAAIEADPQAAVKIKLAEMDYQNQEKQRQSEERLKILTAQLADVQNARQMNVDTTKATGKRDKNLYALAWVIVVGFFALVGILIFVTLPPDSNGVVFMLFGALASGFTGIVGYFFGSSAGHAEATRLLSEAPPIRKGAA